MKLENKRENSGRCVCHMRGGSRLMHLPKVPSTPNTKITRALRLCQRQDSSDGVASGGGGRRWTEDDGTLGWVILYRKRVRVSARNVGQTPMKGKVEDASPTLPFPSRADKATSPNRMRGRASYRRSLERVGPIARAGKRIFGFKLQCPELLLKGCEKLGAKSQFTKSCGGLESG